MIIVAIGALIVLTIFLIIGFAGTTSKETKKVGFIMSGSRNESGWNNMHYKGVSDACKELDVQLLVKEDVKEFTGDCIKAIDELAEQGVEMIILSSYGYSKEAVETVKKYPNIVFYGNSSEFHEKNLTSYFVRLYQARYLSGILAGMKTKNNQIGYVAAMANNEVNRGISAFTLGVKHANPDAKVIVTWTNSWDNKEAETNAANRLITDKKIDVITYHQNQPYVIEAAEKAGIYSIGYHTPLKNASSKHLTTVQCDWKLAYKNIILQFLRGKGNSEANYWIGLEKKVIELSEFSDEVSTDIQDKIKEAQVKIQSGDDVFSGLIIDNQGNVRCNENEIISDEILLEQFDWYTEGVEFYEE